MYKEKCCEIIVNHLTSMLDDQFTTSGKSYKELFSSDLFPELSESPHSEEINEFVANLLTDVCEEQYQIHKDDVKEKLDDEISSLFCELFSEEEAKVMYDFCSTEVASKLLRNSDLFKDAISSSRAMLSVAILKAWGSPEIFEQIQEFIDEIEEE